MLAIAVRCIIAVPYIITEPSTRRTAWRHPPVERSGDARHRRVLYYRRAHATDAC